MEDIEIKPAISFDESLKHKRSIYFDVPGDPFAKQRPRATKKGRYITIYTPRETKDYEEKVRKYYNKLYKDVSLDGDLSVEIEGIFTIPQSVSKTKAKLMEDNKIPHNKKPDCDNMGKICLDALNGIAYPDDAQISSLYITKRYGKNPMAKILIKENNDKEK